MERWDVLENELLEMEKAMHRHDDIMEEKDMKKYVEVIRHSTAHLMAMAVEFITKAP